MSASPHPLTSAGSQQLLATVWERNRPLLRARLARLEAAGQKIEAGYLLPDGRQEVGEIAHKLAGSLGMFGYLRGTEIAREIEILLDAEGPVACKQVQELIASLSKALPPL